MPQGIIKYLRAAAVSTVAKGAFVFLFVQAVKSHSYLHHLLVPF